MAVNQIYSTVNTIAKNLGYNGNTIIDTTTYTQFATDTLTGKKEVTYNKLYNLIAKTVFAIDTASDDDMGVIVDPITYGAIARKISYVLQDAETSPEWTPNTPQSPYTVTPKDGIIPKYFEMDINPFTWTDVIEDFQTNTAFRTAEELVGFTDALYTRMYNAYKIAKRGLAINAINALVTYVYKDNTDVNYNRRVRHLLTEYNTKYGTTLTSAGSLADDKYKEFVREEIEKAIANLDTLTSLYNTVGAEGEEVKIARRTTLDDLRVDLSLEISAAIKKFYAENYNEKYIQFPKYNAILNFGIATEPTTIKTDDTTITNVLGILRDKDAVVGSMRNERFVAEYDRWNARTPIKLTSDRTYCVDPTENMILFLND